MHKTQLKPGENRWGVCIPDGVSLSLRHYHLPKEEITGLPPLSAKQMGNRPEGCLPGRFEGTEPGPHSTRATEQLAYWSFWSLADTEPGTVSW